MKISAIVLVLLGALLSGSTHGAGVLPDSLTAFAGETVTFTTTVPPQETPLMVVTWTFTDNRGTTSNIITSSNANITAPDYSGRITLFRATGSLELRGLTIGDTGEYTVTVIPTGAGHQKGYCKLSVYERVSNVSVTINGTELMEFSGPVTLRCFSSGSSLTFQWLNGSSVVTASDRVQLTDGGSALTIVNVTRYDQGPFRCHVSNAHSNGTSDAVDLLIILGPEDIKLTVFPLKEYHDQGSDVILTCSVVSRPPAQFLWYLNGNPSVHNTPELRLMNIQLSQRGNYTCEAFNNRTMKTQTSQPVVLTILKSNVSNAVITPNATDLSEFGSVSFTCSSSGSSRSFRWINRTSEITAGDRVQLMDDGSRLVIINVSRYDAGPFMCHVFNNFSNSTSDAVKLSINFGPENINLTVFPSQQYYQEGSNVDFSCTAVSSPAALYSWFQNEVKLSDTGPVLRLVNVTERQSGNYSCQALNNKTLRSETSQPRILSILVPVSNVLVNPNVTELVEFTGSISLTCSCSGSRGKILWLNGSSEVTASDRVQFTDENSVLIIHAVTRYDHGPFRCNVSNGISNGISEAVELVIKYGPYNVTIVGPQSVYAGDSTMLYCHSESFPAAEITWFFNGQPTHGHAAVHIVPSVQHSNGGTYACAAQNTVTLQNQTDHHELTVTDFSPCDCVPAAGFAAIVTVGICLLLTALIGLVVYCVRRNKRVNSNYPARDKEKRSVKEKHRDVYKKTGTVKNLSF